MHSSPTIPGARWSLSIGSRCSANWPSLSGPCCSVSSARPKPATAAWWRSGYVPSKGTLPRSSTGFWLPDLDLVRETTEGKRPRFKSERQGVVRWLTWVGVAEPPERIDAGSLVRVSLSRLFGSETAPDGYYLQISGVI